MIYSGFDIRYVRHILKPLKDRCKNCNARLDPANYNVEIERQ